MVEFPFFMDDGILVSGLEWMGSFLALAGVYVLAKNKKEGFLLCLGYNVAFLLMSLYTKQWGVLSLMVGYMFLNAMGYRNWRRNSNQESTS